jgi:hypothetical protein
MLKWLPTRTQVFKIRRKSDGLFRAKDGFNTQGRVWNSLTAVKLHILEQGQHGGSGRPYTNDHEVVCYEVKEKRAQPAGDLLQELLEARREREARWRRQNRRG